MAGNSRFHNKDHYHNHHTLSSVGFPDSATDPIASPAHPFKGDFILNGGLSANGGVSFLSANIGKDLYVQNIYNSNVITTNYISGYDSEAVFSDSSTVGHGNNTVTFKYSNGAYFDSDVNVAGTIMIGGNILIVGNVSAYGDLTYIDSNIIGTSALSVNNMGQGIGLTINQNLGISPIARFENAGTIVMELSGNRATINGFLSSNGYVNAPNIAILQGVSAQYFGLSADFQNTFLTVSALSSSWNKGQIAYALLTGGAAMGNLNAPVGYYITTSLSATVLSADSLTSRNANFTGTLSANVLSANTFYGDGSKLTGVVNANGQAAYSLLTGGASIGNLTAPVGYYITTTLSAFALSANTLSARNANFTGTLSADVLSANKFYGDGSKLTGVINANGQAAYALLTGGAAMGNLDAPVGYYITTTLSAFALSANTLSARNANFTGTLSANVLSANTFYGDGSRLTGVVGGTSNPNGQTAYSLLTGGASIGNLTAPVGYYITTTLSAFALSADSLTSRNANFTGTLSANVLSANTFYGNGSRLTGLPVGTVDATQLSGLSAISFSFMFDGMGNPLSFGATPAMAIIPTKCNITYWSLIADTTCSLAVSVLSTNYLNVGTTDFFLSSAFITTATKNQSNASSTSICNYNFIQGDMLKIAISANNNAKTLTMFLTGNKFGAQ